MRTRREVAVCRNSADQCEVALGEGDDGGDAEAGEPGAEFVVEGAELLGAAQVAGAVVEHGGGSEEFEDGFAAALIPDLLEPADDEVFVLFEGRKRMGRG